MSNLDLKTVKHERLHAFDALRALAMMLGVWLHMAMPYTEGLPTGFWPVEERDSTLVSLSVLVIHSWRMELFFLLSGFFTAMLVVRRGVRRTASQRTKRIVFPFLIAMATVGTACSAIWGFGYANLFGGDPGEWVRGWILGGWGIGENAVFGRLWHLWFLYVLMYFIAIGLVGHALLSKRMVSFNSAVSRFMGWGVRSWFGMFILAIPLGLLLVLFNAPNGPEPAYSLIPNMSSMGYYALPFFAGWYLYASRDSIEVLAKRFWWAFTIASSVALPLHAWTLTKAMQSIADGGHESTIMMVVASMSRGLLTVSFSLAMIGVCVLLLSRPGPRLARAIRYFSDSAYWVYLAHMPLVAAMSVWVFARLDWDPKVEVLVGVAVAMLLLMGSYELFVRYTPIGTLLNGKRTRAKKPITPAADPGAAGASAHPMNRRSHGASQPR